MYSAYSENVRQLATYSLTSDQLLCLPLPFNPCPKEIVGDERTQSENV